MKIESKKVTVAASAETLYDHISNFSNLKGALPSQVANFSATEDECSFEISSIAKIKFRIKDKKRPESVVMQTVKGESPVPLEMSFFLDCTEENECVVRVAIDADVPVFLSNMIQKPLEKFVEGVASKIKDFGKQENE